MGTSLQFTQDNLDELISHAISVGDIYRVKFKSDDKIITPKPGDDSRNKYFIILGCDTEFVYGSILINSAPNPYSKFQYPLYISKYQGILMKSCFADCSQLKKIPISIVKRAEYKGQIFPDDLKFIIGAVASNENKSISIAELNRFGIKAEE